MRALELVTYSAAQRAAFRAGALPEEWATAYPQLFDYLDVNRAKTQPARHFREWCAAIHLHRSTGYACLYEKYQFARRHPKKFEVFEQLVPRRVLSLLPRSGRPQGPDLFMYSASTGQWFFAEAKRPGEGLTVSQRQLFPKLERASGCRVRIITVREAG